MKSSQSRNAFFASAGIVVAVALGYCWVQGSERFEAADVPAASGPDVPFAASHSSAQAAEQPAGLGREVDEDAVRELGRTARNVRFLPRSEHDTPIDCDIRVLVSQGGGRIEKMISVRSAQGEATMSLPSDALIQLIEATAPMRSLVALTSKDIPDDTVIHLVVPDAGAIRVRLVDTTGTTLTNRPVMTELVRWDSAMANLVDARYRGALRLEGLTDESGTAYIDHLRPGTHDLLVPEFAEWREAWGRSVVVVAGQVSDVSIAIDMLKPVEFAAVCIDISALLQVRGCSGFVCGYRMALADSGVSADVLG